MNNLEAGFVTLLVPTNQAFEVLNVNSLTLTCVLDSMCIVAVPCFERALPVSWPATKAIPFNLPVIRLPIGSFPRHNFRNLSAVDRTEPDLPLTCANFVNTQVVALRGVIHWDRCRLVSIIIHTLLCGRTIWDSVGAQ